MKREVKRAVSTSIVLTMLASGFAVPSLKKKMDSPVFSSVVADISPDSDYEDNSLLIATEPSIKEEDLLDSEFIDSVNLLMSDDASNMYEIAYHAPVSIEDAMNEVAKEDGILRVEPNYVVEFEGSSPANVTSSTYQWQHDAVHTYEAWDLMRGITTYRTRVAVIDSCPDIYHEDLSANINKTKSRDFSTGTGRTISYDIYQKYVEDHGTHVAGIIAGNSTNGRGVDGIASGPANRNVELICINVGLGGGSLAKTSSIVAAINYAVTCNCKVINLSLGNSIESQLYENAVTSAYKKGVICVCSAGNDGTTSPMYPAASSKAVSVVNLDYYSNSLHRSQNSNYGSTVDIAAPGTLVYSCVSGDKYQLMSGTSMAAPVITGIISLIYSANPNLTADQVINILYSCATDIGARGRDNETGYGCADAYECVWEAIRLRDVKLLPRRHVPHSINVLFERRSASTKDYVNFLLKFPDINYCYSFRASVFELYSTSITICDFYEILIHSEEFAKIKNLSMDPYIKAVYRIFLFREPTSSELNSARMTLMGAKNGQMRLIYTLIRSNESRQYFEKNFPALVYGDPTLSDYTWNKN